MDAFLISMLSISLAEIGDRSLFLALLFGLRYRRPWPIFIGMVLGLFLNQLLTALFGQWIFSLIPTGWQTGLIAAIFLVMAVWVLFEEDESEKPVGTQRSLILTSAISFFLLEMADKTQVAVIMLMGVYDHLVAVVLGATLGILLVTTPALWLGHHFADRIPRKTMRWVACGVFTLLALWLVVDPLGNDLANF